jgi:hypothetical protein
MMQKDNSLKIRLKEALEQRGVKVPTLSKHTGIPKDRIYAWYRDNTDPKMNDAEKLEKWLNEEKPSENEGNGQVEEMKALQSTDNLTLLRILDNLSAAHREISESNNKLADNEKAILAKIPNSIGDPETMKDVVATVLGLREYVTELAADLKKTSIEDAKAQLGTKSTAARRRIGKMDIGVDGGK